MMIKKKRKKGKEKNENDKNNRNTETRLIARLQFVIEYRLVRTTLQERPTM